MSDGSKLSLAESYKVLFEAVRATAPGQLNESFRLRYQVYCVENHFLDPADNPGGLETDGHDHHALHALLIHRATNSVCGTTRLVLPKLGPVAGRLPLFDACPEAAELLPTATTAAFSRFAISKAFRRRVADGLYGRAYTPEEIASDSRRIIPHITLGLMAAALRMAVDYGIDHVCAIMEPSLLRLLSRFGINFVPLGPMVDYHGLRQPCYAEISELLETMESERPDIWEVVTDYGQVRLRG
jgi:N-acyl amino acid synthase of PEP-CTERM/exosortase system